jgi:hypothetical protein
MARLIPSNEFWGRKSGTVHKDGSNAFRQGQWGSGRSNDGKGGPKRFHWPLPYKHMSAANLRGRRG